MPSRPASKMIRPVQDRGRQRQRHRHQGVGIENADAGRGQARDADLQEAQHGRSAADVAVKGHQRERRRVGTGESDAGQLQEQQRQRGGQAEPAAGRSTSSTKATGQATSRVARNICSLANLQKQEDVDLIAANEADRQARKNAAKLPCAHVKDFHENNRRAGHINEQTGEREGPGESVKVRNCGSRRTMA